MSVWVSISTPQGSQVSLLLFVIYISCLHLEIPIRLTLSCVDDFALTVSISYWGNMQQLQRYYSTLKTNGSRLGVGFSVLKTQLINWRTARHRSPLSTSSIHRNNAIFYPKAELRWLGYYVTHSFSTCAHFVKRLAKAQAGFGGQETLPSREGHPPLPLPQVGVLPAVPDTYLHG